ncbi:MAG: pyrrolo-quinoline quinone [Acidobacteriia bacterium]|nr:pyrrolo-quinoline quinone [Terriglobia bacterium]
MGANLSETTLTTANVNVNSFGRLTKSAHLDGVIFTQPLFVRNLAIAGGTHNVIFLGTENDSVYALDANDPTQILWKRSFIDPASGITPADGNFGGRTGIGPLVGVTGTPVIDPTTQTLYVSAMTLENGTTFHRLHALDITTAAEKFGGPSEISATVPGTGIDTDGHGNVAFNPPTQSQRAALQLVNGVVYIAFASFSDTEPYHGWIFAYDAATLAQLAVLNLSPNSEGAGLWQAGAAPTVDAEGNLYVQTGDGHNFNIIGGPDWGDTILKLKLNSGSFSVVDWFMPYNQDCIDQDDLDLGSGGPMLLPDQAGPHPHLMVSGSKEGRIYLIDRDNLGNFNLGSNSQIPQEILINPAPCGQLDVNNTLRIYGTASYWNGFVYIGSVGSNLRAFQLANGQLTQTSISGTIFQGNGQQGRGPIPVVSANGTTAGIVWTVEYTLSNTVTLHAYDATNLANELYNTQQNAARDALGRGAVFAVPTVIDGRVYVVAVDQLSVYGPLP